MAAQEQQLRESCRKLLAEGSVKVVIGYGGARACVHPPR